MIIHRCACEKSYTPIIMTSITWAGPRCVQELGKFLAPHSGTLCGVSCKQERFSLFACGQKTKSFQQAMFVSFLVGFFLLLSSQILNIEHWSRNTCDSCEIWLSVYRVYHWLHCSTPALILTARNTDMVVMSNEVIFTLLANSSTGAGLTLM